MNGTLPLFDDLAPVPPPAPVASSHGSSSARVPRDRPGEEPGQRADERPDEADKHLRAAWRLSRSMWRYRDHSPEQRRAGLAICHHLQALLARADGG